MQKTKRQLAEEKRELRLALEAIYGMDNKPVDTVIRFFKLFEEGGDEYAYIAQKIREDTWHCNGQYMTWDDLLFELDRDNIYMHSPSLIKVATAWEDFSNEPPF